MVLRKAAMALLLLRLVSNRRSLNFETIAHGLASVRAYLKKYPLLFEAVAVAEKLIMVLLQWVRRHVDRAAVAVMSKLQDPHPFSGVANTRWGAVVSEILKKMLTCVIAWVIKIDSALRRLAPFARFKIVCNVLRRKKRASRCMGASIL
jgi:hypothetical protein